MPSSVTPEALAPASELSEMMANAIHWLRIAAQRRAAAGAQTERISRAVAEACRRVISTPEGCATIAEIARRRGWQASSLLCSVAALCRPLTSAQALADFARDFPTGKGVIGLIMAGNIPGAGLHELVAALVTGWSALVKVASQEPLFFSAFGEALTQTGDGFRGLAMFNWRREETEMTAVMRRDCDRIVIFGDNETVGNIKQERDAGFGDRVSICVIDPQQTRSESASRVAWDISLFEQCGCLSPHHIFVLERSAGEGRDFAAVLAHEMKIIASRALPLPECIPTETAAIIRSEHERARWRAANGASVELWAEPGLRWSVIYDYHALFTRSLGYRMVFVSPFKDARDLARRLEPIAGQLEACALDARNVEVRAVVEAAGATYICRPGEMQSPPLDWKHGGGAFHRLLRNS